MYISFIKPTRHNQLTFNYFSPRINYSPPASIAGTITLRLLSPGVLGLFTITILMNYSQPASLQGAIALRLLFSLHWGCHSSMRRVIESIAKKYRKKGLLITQNPFHNANDHYSVQEHATYVFQGLSVQKKALYFCTIRVSRWIVFK